ncbi:addiction module protein [Candidatus Methylomicrobium oryzae]|jgi:putative addiction module component (TIGR02574 family)|uniref:addiction module protein n=1 Tax=Candidatus Methylomicrobium oryzae TaxID=2802053 RepID=UPI0019212511|nr:addiction module protein [Methylomicrobium sp. RS1]MBL1262404.1 addiction module protein [Methylomicrobium sp. RS1]
MKTKELIAEAVSLPVEERALLVDCLLSSLNTPEQGVDENWVTVAKNRLQELKSGEIKAISSEEVFKKIAAKFQQ